MDNDGVFDEETAEIYDANHGRTDPNILDLAVETLRELAMDGRALEFAVGTGRVALPLQDRGVPVAGLELSKAMVAKLREKEVGAPLHIAIGDMTTTRVDGEFSLVFLVFNTIENLTTQALQVACFKNAAIHLRYGGRFLIETLVPPLQKLPFGETQRAFACSEKHWGIDEFDVTTQDYTSHHTWISEGRQSRLSVPLRYVWPAELDLMANIAGLELEYRWDGWNREPYTRLSNSHISVWRKARD